MDTYVPQSLAQGEKVMEQAINLKENINVFHPVTKDNNRRILGTAMALLNQAQSELDQNRRQIKLLKKQIAKLEETATTDMLTGLKNRRGFEQAFDAELDRVRRENSMGGILLIIDMDNFKGINDTHGHAAGDACLKLVGQVLRHDIRDMDTAARLGGDEFVILMADTSADAMLGRIQSLIWKLNNLSIIWNEAEVRISASIGMKPYDKNGSAAEIFSAADHNMYANKQKTKESVRITALQ